MLSLGSSLGQGLFYWPQASPADGGTVNSSIASRAEDAIVEHYQAIPAPAYVFDSWSLYPRGEHGESLYVHTYDPRLSYTEQIKPITPLFSPMNSAQIRSSRTFRQKQIPSNSTDFRTTT
jgi:hypothetical protein